jgi:hypothetical protein
MLARDLDLVCMHESSPADDVLAAHDEPVHTVGRS